MLQRLTLKPSTVARGSRSPQLHCRTLYLDGDTVSSDTADDAVADEGCDGDDEDHDLDFREDGHHDDVP